MSDKRQALLDRLDQMENAEPWRAEVGDSLVGTVESTDSRATEFDPDCPVIGVLDDGGSLWEVYGFGAVLKGQLLKQKPQVGDTVALRRSEDRISASTRKPYKCFSLLVDRKPEPFDWDKVSPEGGDVPAAEVRELTHGEITRRLVEEDRQRGPRPVEEKTDPPSGEIADEEWKAPWDD